MADAHDPVSGSCLCGAVRFEIDQPSKWTAHCHCSVCRSAHTAALVTWTGVEEAHFRLTVGAGALRWYESSEDARRGFCPTCGSTLFFRSSRWEGEVHIALGALHGDVEPPPAAHVFFDTHVRWVQLGDDLPRLGGESGTEPIEPR